MSERKGTKALELWCKRLVKDCPNVHIENMTTSWRNGIAFCSLVHHFRPDLIDLSTLKPEDVYYNNQLAFSIAEKQLGIPALLDPEDMVENDVPDRLSILTYLSQFYQRLGHTVGPKYNAESESKDSVPVSPLHTTSHVSKNFVKADLDKCTICGQSVYLAQRLIVSHKLYHRRCFRCSKCSIQLSPRSCSNIIEGSEIYCDSCKNESTTKYYNNNDVQMGMLAFGDQSHKHDITGDNVEDQKVTTKPNTRPLSVLDKINLFEKNSKEENTPTEEKFSKLCLKEINDREVKIVTKNLTNTKEDTDSASSNSISTIKNHSNDSKQELIYPIESVNENSSSEQPQCKDIPDLYKSNINKYNFLQTQLSSDILLNTSKDIETNCTEENVHTETVTDKNCVSETLSNSKDTVLKEENINVTDEVRLIEHNINNTHDSDLNFKIDIVESTDPVDEGNKINHVDDENKINIPPRLKKANKEKTKNDIKQQSKEYPDNLNPFSDEEAEDEVCNTVQTKGTSFQSQSTNPFGSSDEDDDPIPISNKPQTMKRLIAVNPFWSDGEEPTSDDEPQERSNMYNKSSMTTSTPNLLTSTPMRKKARAPPPPPVISVSEAPDIEHRSCSMEDVASLTSVSSYNSTVHSDHKTPSKLTPRSRKKKLAPTPPDSLSTTSSRDVYESSSTLEKGGTLYGIIESGSRRAKGPAPGLPLPERREVKLQMSPEQLQVQLDLLETQQLGLERQGVLIEQMIRDKCEGDEACSVPQEEVEDLVIQLCELVNEKNDLFRKHTELMYIRRQQRLEQEQADIEHEIRIIQSQPAVNRIDSDKAREEQLVSRLVDIVRLRDELVQQLDAERRRERQEDLAIAVSIAHKRAQRNSDSNTSSMKSFEETPTPKKNKVKDKVKKQLKKAKQTLHIKKKEDKEERNKDKGAEKEHKTKWF